MDHIDTFTVVPASPNHPGITVRKSQPRTEYVRIWKIELRATSTAASSLEPRAREFQMSTIAMQRASPIRISPFR